VPVKSVVSMAMTIRVVVGMVVTIRVVVRKGVLMSGL